MKFCTKCGETIEDNKNFCTKCGNKINDARLCLYSEATINEINKNEKGERNFNLANTNKKSIRELSKKQMRAFIVVGLLVVLCIGAYVTGKNITDKDRVASKFKEAVSTKNPAEMAKYVVCSDPTLKIDSENINALIKYLENEPSYVNRIIEAVDNQSEAIEANSISTKGVSEQSLFTLKKEGKKWLIFDNYVFEIKPVYIKISTNFSDVEMYVDEELVATSNEDVQGFEVGPYVPGTYDLKASFKGKYIAVDKDIPTELVSSAVSGQEKNSVNMFFNERYVNVSADQEFNDANLFINGVDTQIEVKDAKNIGPVDEKTKIYAVKTVEGKEIKSQEETVGYGSYMQLDFSNSSVTSTQTNTENVTAQSPKFDIVGVSSKLVEKNITHESNLAIDGDKTTAWVEGVNGSGTGEWIKIQNNEEQTVSSISVINGYAKNSDLYYANNRVSKVSIEFSDGTTMTKDLKDGDMSAQTITLDQAKKTKYIKVTILGVYRGSKYDDTCISEIGVF